jgi:hypothetical protein
MAGLIGVEAPSLIGSVAVGPPMQTGDDLDWWEHRIEADDSIPMGIACEAAGVIECRPSVSCRVDTVRNGRAHPISDE